MIYVELIVIFRHYHVSCPPLLTQARGLLVGIYVELIISFRHYYVS